jgi:hypothetical protein
MFLDAITRKLQAVLAGAITTTNPTVVCDWVDLSATATTPGTTVNNLNGTTAVDIIPAPAAATQRKVNGISIYNADTVAVQCTVRYNDNATLYTIVKVMLGVGDTLVYTDTKGWFVLDAAGNEKTTGAGGAGRYIRTQVISAGTTLQVSPATNTIFARVQGGGGGGGGVALNAAGNGTVGGGGSAGAYAEKTFAVIPNTTYTVAIGAAGAAGASGGGTGGAGGQTTLAVGAVTVTAPGGLGGTFLATGAVANSALGGASPAAATNGDVNQGGMPGRMGWLVAAGASGVGGGGGDSNFGNGGDERKTTGAGTAAKGFGAGGSGALSLASGAAAAGGAGAGGVIVVDEYS